MPINDLLRKVVWFEKREKFDIDFFDALLPQRIVSSDERYKSGVFHSDKCRRDIQYESGMELDFIKTLERSEKVVFYVEQPVKIKYMRGRRRLTYTPDFGIYLDTKEFVIVEIKDLHSMLEDRVQIKTEALLDFCSRRGFGLLLTDGKNTFDKLKKIRYNRDLEKEILNAIDDKVLRKDEYSEIMKSCGSTHNELLRIILKNNLFYREFPFKLQHGSKNEIFRQVFVNKKKYDEVISESPERILRITGRLVI